MLGGVYCSDGRKYDGQLYTLYMEGCTAVTDVNTMDNAFIRTQDPVEKQKRRQIVNLYTIVRVQLTIALRMRNVSPAVGVYVGRHPVEMVEAVLNNKHSKTPFPRTAKRSELRNQPIDVGVPDDTSVSEVLDKLIAAGWY